MKLATALLAAAALAGTASAQIDVSVTPANVTPGQTVTVKITNNSNATWTLPTLCVYRGVHETGMNGDQILNLFCGGSLVSVAPGQSKTQTWDQTDDIGNQVGSGTYAFRIEIFDPSFTLRKFSGQVNVANCATPPVHYGPSSAGTNGISPKIGYQDEPQVGTPNFELQFADGVGANSALFLIGVADATGTPVGWGTFLLDVNFPVLSSPVFSFTNGRATLPAPIPGNASLIGGTAALQLVAFDANSSGGLSHSRGMTITVCP